MALSPNTKTHEQTTHIDIIETILQLPRGVSDPNGPNLISETSEQNLKEKMPDGTPISRKIVKKIVRLDPSKTFKEQSVEDSKLTKKPVESKIIEDDGDDVEQ